MTFTIATTAARTWNAAKPHLSILAGTAITLIALAGAAFFADSRSEEPLSTKSRIAPVLNRPAPRPHFLTYYIVDSQEQREFAFRGEALAAEDRGENGSTPSDDNSYSVLQFASPADEAKFTSEMNSIVGQDPGLHVFVVDLRSR